MCLNYRISPVLSRNQLFQMEDYSSMTVWGRVGSPGNAHCRKQVKLLNMVRKLCEGGCLHSHDRIAQYIKRSGPKKFEIIYGKEIYTQKIHIKEVKSITIIQKKYMKTIKFVLSLRKNISLPPASRPQGITLKNEYFYSCFFCNKQTCVDSSPDLI